MGGFTHNTMSEIVKFDYEGQNISFEFADGNRMINATEMARPFGKRVNNFLRMEGTKEYILVLESRYADSRNEEKREVLRVIQGGTPELQGTWMDEKLALKFATKVSQLALHTMNAMARCGRIMRMCSKR